MKGAATMATVDLDVEKPDQGEHDRQENLPRQTFKQGLVGDAQLYLEDGRGRVTERRLIPRPTHKPEDPLNWTLWRKYLAYFSISFFVFLSNYVTASIGPGLVPIAEELRATQTQASYLITFNILFLGLGNIFWVPLAVKIGKRPVLILCSAIFFASSIWSAEATSYGSLLAARIVQGFGASASEALGAAIVADIFFLHERGRLIGFYTLMISTGSALGSLFAGFVINSSQNWRWINWMNSILTGACFLLVLILQPETNFERPAVSELGDRDSSSDQTTGPVSEYTWWKSMNLFTGYNVDRTLLSLYWRPLVLLAYPAVIWCALSYGVVLGWVVFQQTANSIFFPELYHFGPLAVGNISVANLIGALIGCFFGGPLSDALTAFLSKRRQGLFTPELRLFALIPAFIFGPIGLMLWGAGIGEQMHWSVPVAGSGITYAVLCAVPSVGMTYVVDCYRPLSSETLTSLTAFKNTFAFGVSFSVVPWILRDGTTKVGGFMTLIEGVVFLTAIPMVIFGERARKITGKYYI